MTAQSRQETAEDRLTLVSFSIGTQRIAIPALALREVLEPLAVTRVPGAGPFATGVVNVRGSVVPLADLGIALGIPRGAADERQRIMVTEVELEGDPAIIAVHADTVHEVTTISRRHLLPVPASMTAWQAEFIEGLYKSEEGFTLLPDLARIFAALAKKPISFRTEDR